MKELLLNTPTQNLVVTPTIDDSGRVTYEVTLRFTGVSKPVETLIGNYYSHNNEWVANVYADPSNGFWELLKKDLPYGALGIQVAQVVYECAMRAMCMTADTQSTPEYLDQNGIPVYGSDTSDVEVSHFS